MEQTTPTSTDETVTSRARYLQKLMDHLWNRWRREYIPAFRESHRLKLDSAGQMAQIGASSEYMMNLFPVRNGEWVSFTSWLRESTRRRREQLSALLTRERVHIYGVRYSPCFPLWNPLSKLVSVRCYRACALLSELRRNNSEQHSILFTCNSRVYFVAFHFSVQVFELVIDNKTVFKLL